MKNFVRTFLVLIIMAPLVTACNSSDMDAGGSGLLKATDGKLAIPLKAVSDGKAHHYLVKAGDGTMVTFFVLKSGDGVIRAAIDACDVCYKAGKGYYQQGDNMVCKKMNVSLDFCSKIFHHRF